MTRRFKLPRAIRWIAFNDEPCERDLAVIAGMISVQLIADVVDRPAVVIAKQVLRARLCGDDGSVSAQTGSAHATFQDRWRVSREGDPHHGQMGRDLGYEANEDGDRVRLVFADGTTALLAPHELFPVLERGTVC